MKKSNLLPVLFAFVLVLTGAACKKSKDEAVAPTKENLAGTYKLISIKAKVTGTAEQDITNQYLEPCQLDDLYTLNANLTYQYVDAGTKCDPAGDYNDTWSLQGNVISFADYEFTITKFDGKNLVGSETFQEQGMTVTMTGTFQKQ